MLIHLMKQPLEIVFTYKIECLGVSHLTSTGHTSLPGSVVGMENSKGQDIKRQFCWAISKDRMGGGNQHFYLPFSTTQRSFLGQRTLWEGPQMSSKDPNLMLMGKQQIGVHSDRISRVILFSRSTPSTPFRSPTTFPASSLSARIKTVGEQVTKLWIYLNGLYFYLQFRIRQFL